MTTRDSLGILIVENSAPAELQAPWILDTVSVIDIGSQAADARKAVHLRDDRGKPPAVLADVRISHSGWRGGILESRGAR